MQARTLFFLLVWSSVVWAGDPPNLPFRPLDDSMKAVRSDEQVTGPSASISKNPQSTTGTQESQSQSISTDQLRKKPLLADRAPATQAKKSQEMNIGLQSGITIKPKPGRTENAVIAKDKLNPIITPLANPKVLTVDEFESRVEGSVVYVTTSADTPISMFIADIDDPSRAAISLQLTPENLPAPVEIRIEAPLSNMSGNVSASSKSDALFRHDSPYVEDIKSIMQSLGKQQIPQGFTLEEVTRDLHLASICHNINLNFIPGQLLSGHDSRIVIMVAQNNGVTASIFEEAYCAGENVMAVAAWPKVRLEPGERTEVFILMRLPQGKSGEEFRPALL